MATHLFLKETHICKRVLNRAANPESFIIAARIVKRQTLRVNLIDRDVDVHVARVVVDHAYALMFSVAERIAKTLLNHP